MTTYKPGDGLRITDTRRYRGTHFHRGYDLAPIGAYNPKTNPVYLYPVKKEQGTAHVHYEAGGFGHYVTVRYPGATTTLAHMDKVLVKTGQTVNFDTALGILGKTGLATGYHVHHEEHNSNPPKYTKEGTLPIEYQERNSNSNQTEMVTIQKPITLKTLNTAPMNLRKEASSKAESWGKIVPPLSSHQCNVFAIGERLQQNGRDLDLWYRITIDGKAGFISACWADETTADCSVVENELKAEKAKSADYKARLDQIKGIATI